MIEQGIEALYGLRNNFRVATRKRSSMGHVAAAEAIRLVPLCGYVYKDRHWEHVYAPQPHHQAFV